jgi:peptidoglycan/xylan/chitin deacetylase (PgdA/CDA1 family)
MIKRKHDSRVRVDKTSAGGVLGQQIIRRRRWRPAMHVALVLLAICVGLLVWHLATPGTNNPDNTELIAKNETLDGIGIESIIKNGGSRVAVHYPKTKNEIVNQNLLSFAEKSVDSFENHIAHFGGDGQDELYITFKVYRFDEDIVSFKFKKYTSHTGDAHGINEITTMTFNLGDAKQYELKDLFSGTDYLKSLSECVYNGLKDDEMYKNRLDLLRSGTEPKYENFDLFAISDSKLIIFFDKYQIGPNDTEVSHFDIELKSLENILSETFRPPNDTVITPDKPPAPAPEQPAPTDTDNLVGKKLIALTFDDGPHASLTPRLLDILKKNNAKATFFMLGSRVKYYPAVVQRAYSEGHQIASHTYNHKDLTTLSAGNLRAEIDGTANAIEQIIGIKPTALRPPYGAFNNAVRTYANAPIILWSVDPLDWKYRNAGVVYNNVIGAARDGSIVLMHDIHQTSVEAAARIIPKLQADRFTLVTIEQLIRARGTPVNGQAYYSMYP